MRRQVSMALLLLATTAVFKAQAAAAADDAQILVATGNGNAIVDNLLQNLKEKKSAELDPYLLPNSTMGVWYKLYFNFTGELHLHSGYVVGLATIRRTGDSGMQLRDGKIHIDARMGIGPLYGEYLAKVSFMAYGPTITIKVDAGYADLDMDLMLVKGKPELHDLHLYELEGFRVNISGLGPINYVFNTWSTLITKFLKGLVRKFIEYGLRKAVSDVVKELV